MSPKDAKRQKPEQLGLPLEGRGEASRVQRSGEASTLANREERSGSDRLMEWTYPDSIDGMGLGFKSRI